MKVLHVITSLNTGGSEMMLLKLVGKMDRKCFSNVVVALSDQGSIKEKLNAEGISVYGLGVTNSFCLPLGIVRLMKIIRYEKPDILQTWLFYSDFIGLIAGKAMGVSTIIWNIRCSTLVFKNLKPALRLTIRVLSKVSKIPNAIVVNTFAGLQFFKKLGYQSRNWMVIPNGFYLDQFSPSEAARQNIRQELKLPEDAILVGLVARYDPMKDHQTFLRAAAEAIKFRPDIHFILVGKDVNSLNMFLEKDISRYQLNKQVHLLGERKDIPQVTASLDIATCSSCTEGFPNIIGEAMACAVPCVSTDVGDNKQIIGEAGIIVPVGDAEALARAWLELLAIGPTGMKALGEIGRARIMEKYNLETVVKRYEDLYVNLASAPFFGQS